MPIYEYRCNKCGGVSSFLERPGEWRFWRRRCEYCGSFRLHKIISNFSTARKPSITDMMNDLDSRGVARFTPTGQPSSRENSATSSDNRTTK